MLNYLAVVGAELQGIKHAAHASIEHFFQAPNSDVP